MYFCSKVGHFNTEVYGGSSRCWSLEWPLEELQCLTVRLCLTNVSFDLPRFNLCLVLTYLWLLSVACFSHFQLWCRCFFEPTVARAAFPFFHQPNSHYKTRALQSLNELRSLLSHTHPPLTVCVCVFTNQDFGRPNSSWQGEASAVCVGLLLKPLAESFQSPATVLRFCCWSVQAGGSRNSLNQTWLC